MKDTDIVQILSTSGDYNFVGIAVTPWHAHGIDVAIDKLENMGIKLHGLIFTVPFPGAARIISKENFVYKNADIEVIESTFSEKSILEKILDNLVAKKIYKRMKKAKNKFFVARPSYPEFNWIKILANTYKDVRVCFISVDEGCGSYMIDNKDNWVAAMAETFQKRKGIIYALKMTLFKSVAQRRIRFRKTFENILESNDSLYYWRLLKYNDLGNLVIDDEISERYANVFQKTRVSGVLEEEIEIYNNSVIICMAPSFEEGTNVNDADLKLLEILLDVLEDHKDKVVIRTHPRENNPERYYGFGVTVSHLTKVSQELLISKCLIRPKCIISIDSTTLITLRTIFQIPAICLAKMFIDMVNDNKKTEEAAKFIDTFRGIIDLPREKVELKKILQRYIDFSDP